MTMTLDSLGRGTAPASRQLQASFAAVRVAFTWMGVRKSLSSEQKAQAAESFGAQGQYLSAAKKLLDTRYDAFKQVTAIRGRIIAYWKGMSLPYPEPGLRLIRREDIDPFDHRLRELRQELIEAVENLNDQYSELKSAAREQLGTLFSPSDYPGSLTGLFAVDWEFPSV